jgi:RNA polymerase sigma factor (sigma-70 family)
MPMSPQEEEFRRLMARVRAGCEQAAQELFDRYSGHIARVVRRRLHGRLRTQYDSQDFLQAVWASFFAVPLDEYTFERPEDLVGFLARMACNKVIDVTRQRFGTVKHDINRERPLGCAPDGPLEQVAARQPTPSQEVMAEERWEQLLAGLTPRFRRVLELLRNGQTHQTIAQELGLHPKVIQRFLRQLAERWGVP